VPRVAVRPAGGREIVPGRLGAGEVELKWRVTRAALETVDGSMDRARRLLTTLAEAGGEILQNCLRETGDGGR